MSSSSPIFAIKPLTLAVVSGLLLVGCGSDNNSSSSVTPLPQKTGVATLATGELLAEPTARNFTSAQLATELEKIEPILFTQMTSQGDKVKCDVRVEYMHYDTVDVKEGKTDATGAVFIPTGNDPSCQGARPIVLQAHGTATSQGYNFAEVGNYANEAGSRATLVAALFAGKGYVVISPNYAGYDKSSLSYHPYLNAKQQAHEMADALKAGRTVLTKAQADTKVSDNGKLFMTGYSQGGHVVVAAQRYFEQLKEPVTAAVPISGPYAMGAFGDAVFGGNVMLGATFFAPLMARNYQIQYGDVYQSPADIFATPNPAETETLLPSRTLTDRQIVEQGKLPVSAMFQQAPTGNAELDKLSPANPAFAYGFDPNFYAIKTSYRAAYLADMKANPDWSIPYMQGMTNIQPVAALTPQHGLRKALKDNDLRTYVPKSPTIMCGGNQDPMVFFDVNTGIMNNLWRNYYTNVPNTQLGMVDIDITNQATRNKPVYESKGLPATLDNTLRTSSQLMQQGFAQNVQKVATAAGATVYQNAYQQALASGMTEAQAMAAAQTAAANAGKYAVATGYHGLVTPYCMGMAEKLFSQF